ncbi:hypothetical protein [Mesorhizobium sp. AA23]|uniref:hypothetical protein n=1 Tax=Mesorhizobium sp. AA23 TaxID=1854058 RepID=UPI0012EAE99E|nr:hypothetical protein [Mesorhizobium sp. AA23]
MTILDCTTESLDGRALGGADELGRSPLNFVGQVIHLCHPLHDSVTKHRKPGRSVESGALFIMRVKRCKHHRHRVGSSMGACGRRYLEQPPPGCFRSRLPGAYAAAKCDTDRKAVVVIEQGLCLLQGEFGSLSTLPRRRHFQTQNFNHSSASWIAVPSISKPSSSALVPICRLATRRRA